MASNSPGESKTSERRLSAAERRIQALELRKAGVTFPVIAERLGYAGPSGAYKAVMTALRDTVQEPADELRTMELERLDRLMLGVWTAATKGNLGAVDRVLRIMKRRAELLGLDAPVKINLGRVMDEEARRVAEQYGLPYDVVRDRLDELVVSETPAR